MGLIQTTVVDLVGDTNSVYHVEVAKAGATLNLIYCETLWRPRARPEITRSGALAHGWAFYNTGIGFFKISASPQPTLEGPVLSVRVCCTFATIVVNCL